MKLKNLMIGGVTTAILYGGIMTLGENPTTAREPSQSVFLAQASEAILSQGRFVTVDRSHATTGGVRLIEENGVRYLELDENFQTGEGPQVEVILHRQKQVGRRVRERD
ncbi:MAG: DM13 domain-containing protein, partial [Moorea sp. SIO2B7]|nr:DM13 domain-containing protein [Moorena sp. SIO2B7]